ncbi:MAG: fibronectin type III domain-containing protein [Sulfurospirillum sp.]|nr:fibronectin type III domain-containing protein [Sulfurospirillum sp.]MBL0703347.1 fibronectin type III domain-containing protein [Sulfurospirillum sp.]
MKKWTVFALLIVSIIFISGCKNSPQPLKKSAVDQSLPQLENIKFLTDITEVGFEWTPSLDKIVSGYNIYRLDLEKEKEKLIKIVTIKDRHSSHFVDTGLKPATQYQYRFSTFSKDKKESVKSDIINVTTSPLIESVVYIKAINNLPRRVKLIWRPHTFQRVSSYIIERKMFTSSKWERVAQVKGRLNVEYIDSGLRDNFVYRYRVKVETYDGLISKSSKIVEAATKPLPVEIQNLKATIYIPKKVVLKWDASNEKDFSYYKVYRSINPMLYYSYLAKTEDTSYEDLINANGKSYYYLVTAVDKDELESPRQRNAVAGSSLARLDSVYITSSNHNGESANITWKSKDTRAVKYNITKEYQDKKRVFTGVKGNVFNDADIIKGIKYKYNVIAIDKYGLASRKSENIIIKIPKK